MIALISDIHGNYPALVAALREIDSVGCEHIYSLGDVAGYYPMINECITLLMERGIPNIMGNHDYYLITGEPCPRSTSANDCLQFQRGVVAEKNLTWLRKSPAFLTVGEIEMTHGGWHDPRDEYLYSVDEKYFQGLSGKYFFSGHTHIPYLVDLGEKLYCNPGSIGQPRDGDPRASFALFDNGKVLLQRIPYDIDEIADRMKNVGFSRYYFENLYYGQRIGWRSHSLSKDSKN